MVRALVLGFGGELWFVARIRTTQLGVQMLIMSVRRSLLPVVRQWETHLLRVGVDCCTLS
jgi:hypothetical protein